MAGLVVRVALAACEVAELAVPRARARLGGVSPLRRVPWDDVATLFVEVEEACGGDERRLALFAAAGNDSVLELRILAAATLSPERLYRLLIILSSWAYPDIKYRVRYGRRRLDLTLELAPEQRDCAAYFRVNAHTMAYIPTLLGLPPCRFDAQIGPRGASYTFYLPEQRPLAQRARRRTERWCGEGLAWLVDAERKLRRRFRRR